MSASRLPLIRPEEIQKPPAVDTQHFTGNIDVHGLEAELSRNV